MSQVPFIEPPREPGPDDGSNGRAPAGRSPSGGERASTSFSLRWANLPAPMRTLGRWLTLVQLAGYTVGLVFVWQTTRMTPQGAVDRYRGVDPELTEGAMQFPKSLAEMLGTTHNHVLGMAALFAVTGLGVALCSWPGERLRRLLIIEPFVAILVSFSSMWLMRFVDPRFAWLMYVSGTLMALTFYAHCALILLDLHRVSQSRPG